MSSFEFLLKWAVWVISGMSSRLCGGGPCDFSVTALGLGLSLGGLDLGLDNYFNGAGCHCAVSVCYCAISNGSKTDNIDHSADCIKKHMSWRSTSGTLSRPRCLSPWRRSSEVTTNRNNVVLTCIWVIGRESIVKDRFKAIIVLYKYIWENTNADLS